jgi:rod shape-determining protein MreC
MNPRRRARAVLAVLVLASLVLVTADFRSEDGPLDGLRGVATSTFQPLQSGLGSVTRPIVDIFGNAGELWSIRGDNDALRAQIDILDDRRIAAQALQRENDELRALLELRGSTDWVTVAATTVAFTPSNFEWTITIDVGSDVGVREDMPVVAGAGLVGKVIQVTPTSSRVLLAIDPNFSAATRVADSGDIGVVTGRGSDLMRMELDNPAVDIATRTQIVTNSYAFGVFPAGIPVGVVDGFVEGPNELSQTVLVRPYVDFNRLNHVLVILQEPTVAPDPVPDLPARDLNPPQLVPDPTPAPTETPSGGPSDGPSDGDGAAA